MRFVRLTFSRLTFTSRSGRKTDVHPEISNVEFDGPLKFVDSIKDYLKTPGTGPSIDVAPDSVTAGFSLQIPNIPAGALTIMNIVFYAGLRIPFNGIAGPRPVRAEQPRAPVPVHLDRVRRRAASSPSSSGSTASRCSRWTPWAARAVALDAVLVTVEVHAYFGIHLGIGKDDKGNEIIDQISYIRYGGHCNVWGFWGFTIDLYLGLEYDGVANELWGQAKLTVELTYMWLTKDVELSVERRIAGPSGAERDRRSGGSTASTVQGWHRRPHPATPPTARQRRRVRRSGTRP